MRLPFRSLSWALGMCWVWACGADDTGATHTTSAATSGVTAGVTTGSGGSAGGGASSSVVGVTTGALGGATASGTGGAGGGESTGGSNAGGGGSKAEADASLDATAPPADGSTSSPDRVSEGDASALEGCDQNNYALCLDFEKAADPKWTGITANNVQLGKAAHGMAAFHGPPGTMLTATQLGTITNVVWGRFYLHMAPGAPVGHGEMVGVYDQANNWYELGFEFNGLQGNWHGNGGEKYMRTKTKIPDAYICVEFLFDGATPSVAQMWQDGQLIQYYDVSPLAGPTKVTQFKKIEIGFRPFHSLSLTSYDGQNPPLMTDMWIDDIAFDTKRIGCIAP